MPDPNVTLTAIQSHSTALDGAIRRHVASSGWFKVGSAAVVPGAVLLVWGKAQMAVLPWAAGVLLLLALADACHVRMARLCTDAYNGFMRKLPLNGGNAMKAEECFVLPAPEPTWQQAGQVLGALGSLSVLPFYGALLALVVAFHVQMSGDDGGAKSARLLPSAATKGGCSAGGGCGTSGGCGSSGCGASSGKGCGCGSGAAAKSSPSAKAGVPSASAVSPSATPKPVQPVRMSTLPVNPNTGVQTRPTSLQPGQPPTLSPQRPVQQQPGVRLPTVPPVRLPSGAVPPNGVPAGGAPPQAPAPVPVPGAPGQ